MNDQATLSPELIAPTAVAVPVTLEASRATVEVIDLTPKTRSGTLSHYLAHSLPTCTGVVSLLDALANERQNWERTEFAASRARLYGILAECYQMYLTMTSPTTAKSTRKTLSDGLDDFLKQRGLRTLANTHDMNKVVKAVFGDDRRRVSAYAMALRAALMSGPGGVAIPADQLAIWIEQQGGVEEVRLGGKNKGMTGTERADAARAVVSDAAPLLRITPDAKVMPFGADDANKLVLLLVTYRSTGELDVNGVVKNDSAVRTALAAYYAENKKDIADAESTRQQTNTSAIATALSE